MTDEQKAPTLVKLRKCKVLREENTKLRTALEAQMKQTQELMKRLQEATKMYSCDLRINFKEHSEALAFIEHMKTAPPVKQDEKL